MGLYRVTITDPNSLVTEFVNGKTNWFALDTTIGVISKEFSNPSVSLVQTQKSFINFCLINQICSMVDGAIPLCMTHQTATRAKM